MTHVFHRHLRQDYPVAVSGQGPYLIDRDGRRYLDGSGGAAVSCLGHAHPAVVAAVREQGDAALLDCTRRFDGWTPVGPDALEVPRAFRAEFPNPVPGSDMNQLGFRMATRSGLSFATDDLITPPSKATIIHAPSGLCPRNRGARPLASDRA